MEHRANNRSKFSDLLYMFPAVLLILSILLVRLHLFSMPMTDIYWSEATDTSTLTDVFNYWKAIVIIGAAFFAMLFLVIGYFNDSIHFKRSFLYIPLLIYTVFVLISFVLSDFKYFALRGMSEHFEGTIVLMAYITMVFFLANTVDSERRLKYVLFFSLGAAFLLGLLGVTQACGHDFLSTTTGQKLITPSYTLENGMNSWDMIDILAASGQKAYDFSFTNGEVYQTVYNINYVPMYLILLIPVCAGLFVSYGTNENKTRKGISIVFLLLYGLLLYNFFTANAASGYFGLVAIFVSALIIFRKKLKKWRRSIICLIVVLGLVMGITADRWFNDVQEILTSVLDNAAINIYADTIPDLQYDYQEAPGRVKAKIDYIKTYDTYMLFSLNGNAIKVIRDEEHEAYIITDEEDNQLYLRPIENEDGKYEVLDERFHDYARMSLEKKEDYVYVVLTTVWTDWEFRYDGERFVYLNRVGKELPLSPVEHSSMIRNYKAGSSRGLIWATSLPMLKHFVLKGAGADCFVFAYPQYDYATLYNTFDHEHLTQVTDKAHNLYMQYWVNTGLISLLAWLTLVGYYLVGAAKQFRKRSFVEFSDFVNGGIFCGIIGFLFVAFFNDGSVNTMPMFYTMLGTGLAINMRDKWVKTEETSGKKEAAMPEL